MPITLMFITNSPEVALIAEGAGVDRIFVDLEYIGKSDRQGGMDTVQSHHTVDDVRRVRAAITSAELLVRVNPIHAGSEREINDVIAAGADVIMLPYFKTAEEVKKFISFVGKRARVLPLVETPEAVFHIDEILSLDGIDEIFIGLNDLSLGYGRKFMFEPLADGTVEMLTRKFREKGIPYGFGGLASLDGGLLPGRRVLMEHYRLGSGCVILSRSFCNVSRIVDPDVIRDTFTTGVASIRAFEAECLNTSPDAYDENRKEVVRIVKQIVEGK